MNDFTEIDIYPKYEDIDTFYTSKLTRTIETISILYPNAKYKSLEEFNEANFGEYEGHSHKKLMKRDDYVKWQNGDKFIYFDLPGGDNFESFSKRIHNGIEKIFTDIKNNNYKNIVLICHGAVISVIMNNFYKPSDEYYGYLPKNGHGYMLQFDDNSDINSKALKYEEI